MKLSLRALRVNAGYSQGKAADKLGVTTVTIHNWETGKTHPSSNILPLICDLYSCKINDIRLL